MTTTRVERLRGDSVFVINDDEEHDDVLNVRLSSVVENE